MKAELTIEESAKLIELGVDPKMASTGRVREDEHTNKVSFYPIFSLTDILALLPKMLTDRYGKNAPLGMEFDDDYMVWTAYYLGGGYVETQTELIDSLYQLLCWVIENRYINLKTNKK